MNLLAVYLQDIPGHHVSAAEQIPALDIPEAEGKHPRRMIAAFERKLGEGPDGAPLLVQMRKVDLETPEGGRGLTLLAGFDRLVIDQAISEYHGAMIIMLVLTAAVLLAAAFLQIGIGLAPLSRLQSGLSLVRSGRTDHLPEGGPTELRPLVSELNGLLKERETAVERARARASDLAHGLKTPLTVLLQLADGLPQRERDMIRQQVDLIRQRSGQDSLDGGPGTSDPDVDGAEPWTPTCPRPRPDEVAEQRQRLALTLARIQALPDSQERTASSSSLAKASPSQPRPWLL